MECSPYYESDVLAYFDGHAEELALYEAFFRRLCAQFPACSVKVQKSQISFYNRHLFAAASLPVRRKKDWPKTCILVTFGLSHRLDHFPGQMSGGQQQRAGIARAFIARPDSPRVAVAVEPYPNRWTHHVVVSSPQQLDDTLFAWIEEAYQFAESK